MDIVDIKSFLAVAELRSFTLAAKKVSITQSGMSKRIGRVEGELGIRLFIVEKSQVSLTKEAQSILPYMREIYVSFENMIKIIQEETSLAQPRILIGASIFTSHYFLPGFINYLQKANIPLEITINTIPQQDVEYKLNLGLVDVVIFPEVGISSTNVERKILWEEPFYLVANYKSHLAKTDHINYQDLLDLPAVLTKKGINIREKIESQFPEGHSIPKIIEVTTLESVKHILEYDIGWGYLPKDLVSSSIRILDEHNPHMVPFYIYYLKKRSEDKKVLSFLDHLQDWLHPESKDEKILW